MASRARTSSGVIRDLGASGAAALASRSGSYQQLVRQLNQQYPLLRSSGELYAAASAVWQRRAAVVQGPTPRAPQQFSSRITSVRPNQIPNYRYHIQYTYYSPSAGRTVTGYLYIDSTNAIMPADVIRMAADEAVLLGSTTDPSITASEAAAATDLRVVVISVTTRS